MYALKDKIIYKRERFQTLPSTNDYLKEKRAKMLSGELSARENYIVVAEEQTGGRGTKGREFLSEKGGVYMSALTFYEELKTKDAFTLMANAAVAVCETLRFYGLNPVIKWANDIYVNDRKICGILIENVFSGEYISSSIVGIGLNVVNPLAASIQNIATSMQRETGENYDVEAVESRLVSELLTKRTMQDYLSYIGYMGRTVTLYIGDERVHGRLVCVDEQGGLIVSIDGKERRLTSAEVSFSLSPFVTENAYEYGGEE